MCFIAFKSVSVQGILYVFFMRLSILVLNYMQIFFTYVYSLLLCTWCFVLASWVPFCNLSFSIAQHLSVYQTLFGCELRTWGLVFCFRLVSFVYIVNIRFLITIQLLNILYIYTYMYNEYVVKLGCSVFTSIYMYCICMCMHVTYYILCRKCSTCLMFKCFWWWWLIIDVACDVLLLFGGGGKGDFESWRTKKYRVFFCVWNIFRYE